MESSPLIKVGFCCSWTVAWRRFANADVAGQAHDHARAASNATHTADTTAAVNEHVLAAGEFSNAAKSTASVEALRTLRLLEQHHRRLSELLKYPLEHPIQQEESEKGSQDSDAAVHPRTDAPAEAKTKSELPAGIPSTKSTAAVPSLAQPHRYRPARELSSSIASNLASARGIRSKYRGQPLTPSVSNDQAPGNLESGPRKGGGWSKMQNMLETGKPSWAPPPAVALAKQEAQPRRTAPEPVKVEQPPATPSDEGYARFYSAFGSIINRISAPLAFAGLPLVAEETPTESAPTADQPLPKRTRGKAPQPVSTDPDLSRIYSRAALRAISRDGSTANDSFYVVPTSGHTMSYANILSFDQKERRRVTASIHGDDGIIPEDPEDDDFVDAREPPAVPLSPAMSKRVGRSRTEKELHNVIEELNTENASLKDMLDRLSKRLHAFEASAQHSHLALQESMRLRRPGSPHSLPSAAGAAGGGKGQGDSEGQLRRRNKELEDELAIAAKQMEVLEKEYSRLQKTVVKYRDKWEKLKAGAKARREAQGSPVDGGE